MAIALRKSGVIALLVAVCFALLETVSESPAQAQPVPPYNCRVQGGVQDDADGPGLRRLTIGGNVYCNAASHYFEWIYGVVLLTTAAGSNEAQDDALCFGCVFMELSDEQDNVVRGSKHRAYWLERIKLSEGNYWKKWTGPCKPNGRILNCQWHVERTAGIKEDPTFATSSTEVCAPEAGLCVNPEDTALDFLAEIGTLVEQAKSVVDATEPVGESSNPPQPLPALPPTPCQYVGPLAWNACPRDVVDGTQVAPDVRGEVVDPVLYYLCWRHQICATVPGS